MEHMERNKFLNLPAEKVANIVRAGGSKVCVFPFNGTRRWFLLEYGRDFDGNAAENYVELTTHAYINTYKLVFDHGIDTIVAPVFGGEIMNRGDEYMREIGANMTLLATHPAFLEFYESHGIRVHFYGDYRRKLRGTPYRSICDTFDEITQKTAHHTKRRLFYGVWADESTETIAELSVKHYQAHGKIPSRRELIEQYYGECIEKADIFIGFEKFNVFDYPMLGWGEESLYFTVAPSLYMNDRQLRDILFDYVYLRPVQDPDYFTMPKKDFEAMRKFYEANRDVTFGVGEIRGGIWYPKSKITNVKKD
jgi:tuberculosinol/isotuberculosinol synthase